MALCNEIASIPCNPCKKCVHNMLQTRRLYIGSISASPTACLLRGYERAGTRIDRLGKEVILSTDTPMPAQKAYLYRS